MAKEADRLFEAGNTLMQGMVSALLMYMCWWWLGLGRRLDATVRQRAIGSAGAISI